MLNTTYVQFKSCKQKIAWLILNRECFPSNISSGGILIIWSQLDCFHCLRVLYWAHNRQLLQADHVLTYKNQVHKLLFWLIWKKRHFPRIGDKTGTTSKESASGALILRKQLQESGQTLRADPMCCPSWQYGQPIGNLWLNTKRRGSLPLRSYFEVASIECVPSPPIFHTFTQESLPLYAGLMTSLLWLSLLFHTPLQRSLWLIWNDLFVMTVMMTSSGKIPVMTNTVALDWPSYWSNEFPRALHHQYQHHRHFHYHHHFHHRCHWNLTNQRAWIVFEHPFLDFKICLEIFTWRICWERNQMMIWCWDRAEVNI